MKARTGWWVAALLAAVPAAAQDSAAARRPAMEHELSARLRPRMSTSSAPGEESPRWELQRLRLQGRLGIAGLVSSRLQLDYDAGEWTVDDAWVRLEAGRSVRLLLGQGKRPFTVLSMRGGSQVSPASRGASLNGVNAVEEQNMVSDLGLGDRAIGVQLSGPVPFTRSAVHATAGFFPADVRRAPLDADGAQVSVRMVGAVRSGVVMGGAWSTRFSGGAGESAPPAGTAVGLDVEVGDDDPGVHLLAEVVAGSSRGAGAGRYTGAHAWLMYRAPARVPARVAVEPVLRWSVATGAVPAGDAGTLITGGVNLYVGDPARWNRLTVNYDLWRPGGPTAHAHGLKVGLQVGT